MPEAAGATEPTLRKHRGKFCLYWRTDGVIRRRSLGTEDRHEALRRMESLRGRSRERELARGHTVASLWDARRTALEGRRQAMNMEWSGRAILPFFGHLEPSHITKQKCREYIEARETQGRKSGTISTELGHLRQMLNWANGEGIINVPVRMVVPQGSSPRNLHITKEQARQMVDVCAYAHLRLFILLALSTGARSQALLQLDWGRVDFESRRIDLRSADMSNRKGRSIVPINDRLLEALTEAKRGALTNYVIEWAGKPVTSVRKGVSSAATAAGVPFVTPHIFRHSAAVWMAEEGIDMEAIAQYLGHDDVATTRKWYARFSPEYQRKAAQALEF